MIFHTFPRASQTYRLQRQQPLDGAVLPPLDTLLARLPDSVQLQGLSLEMRFDRPAVTLRGPGFADERYADDGRPLEPFGEPVRLQTLRLWCDAPVERVDTLWQVDQWIPFESLRRELPVYRYRFADAARHELYMASRDGRVLQFTDRRSRFWAWLGAIPHWVYFTLLRQHQTLWIETVKWAAGIGCLMCLAGWLLGLYRWGHHRRTAGRWENPYKKRWYRWHFASGLIFGLFALTFALSGLMSLVELPDWLKKAPRTATAATAAEGRPRGRSRGTGEAGMAPAAAYRLDYRRLLDPADSVKTLAFASWEGHPCYQLVVGSGETRYIDAADSASVRPFRLTEERIRARMARELPDSVRWELALLTAFDDDYFARQAERAPLPVWRVTVDDAMHTRLYFHPDRLTLRRVDDDTRTRSLLYQGLHTLHFKFLTDRPALWYVAMFGLLLGGTLLSLSGVVLTLQWLRRTVRKIRTTSSH